ncbi:MAG: outer membrane protein transport protein [Myxococcota bacterium]
MITLFAIAVAQAGGFDAPQVGSVNSGPMNADAAALFYNPALLSHVEGPSVLVGAGAVVGRVTVRRERLGNYGFSDQLNLVAPTDPAELDPSRTGLTDRVGATPFAPLGDLFVAVPVDRVTFGAGAYVPYAAILRFPEEGPQRFALRDTTLLISHLAGGAAVDLGKVSLGARASYVFGAGSIARVTDFAGLKFFADVITEPPVSQPNDFGRRAPSEVREQEVLARDFAVRRGISHGFTFAFGASVDLGDWRVAASYDHGSTVTFQGRFTVDTNDPFFTSDLAPIGLSFPTVIEGDGSFSVATPRRVRLGLAHTFASGLQAQFSGEWADWRRYDATRLVLTSPGFEQPELGIPETVNVRIDRQWQPAWGLDFTVQQATWVAGLGVASPASPDATVDAASPDGYRLLAKGGTQIRLSDRTGWWVGGKLQGILPRTVTTSDHDLANGRYGLWLASLTSHFTFASR